jgi:hypothetical protein
MIKVHTETGSIYELDVANTKVRRVFHTEASSDLRRDEEWVQMLLWPEIKTGASMYLILEPLGEGNVTMRTTSYVVKVEEID